MSFKVALPCADFKIMACSRGIIQLTFSLSLFVSLHGQFPNLDDENDLLKNYTTLWDLLKPQSNPYLQELSGHWSFNDTVDLSKYEEFDHTRFEGTREISMEEVLAKVKERAKIKANQAKMIISIKRPPTQPPEELPSFDPDQITNSTAQLGGTAYLTCRIRNLNNRAVSWVRKRDWHILTSAMFTYTNDERFQVMHAEGSEEWVLQIKFVQRRDAGAYECQVATGRGTMAHYFNLNVVIPTATILGTGEYHIGQGSTINLVCVIENSPSPPQYVMWYHNEKMINYDTSVGTLVDSEGGKVQVQTNYSPEQTESKLLVTEATPANSGNYTCRASNTEPDSVYVFVSTDGDNIAAIQRQDASSVMHPCLALLCLVLSAHRMVHW